MHEHGPSLNDEPDSSNDQAISIRVTVMDEARRLAV
jgi:hypothetical protein